MKLEQNEFTGTLKGKIVDAERKFAKLCDTLNQKYKEAAAARNLDVEFVMERKGYDSFTPHYISEVTLGVARKETVLDIHRVVIWECQREFLGLPIKWNLPGSKVVGDFLDESYEHVAKELEKHVESFLQPETAN